MENLHTCNWTYAKADPLWDDFVAGLPDGHYEQTTCWARVREVQGWQVIRLKFERNGNILAGVQILFRKIPWIGKVGYVPYGPCIPVGSDELAHELLGEVKKRVMKERWAYIVMNLPYFGHSLVPVLKKNRFLPAIKELPPKLIVPSTLLIDLTKSLEEILDGFKSKTRQNIRYAIREGLQLREGTREDIDTFFRLMLTTCERRKSDPLHPKIEDFYRFWDSFYEREWVRLFLIDYMQEPVCAAFGFSFGPILFMYQFGWSGQHGHMQPSKLLFWKTIEWAKNKGFRYYDFVSIDTEVSKAVEAGLPINEELQKRAFYGPTHLKLSFGGTIVHLPGAFAYYPNVLLRVFSNTILRLILKQDWFFRLIHAIWAKQKRKGK